MSPTLHSFSRRTPLFWVVGRECTRCDHKDGAGFHHECAREALGSDTWYCLCSNCKNPMLRHYFPKSAATGMTCPACVSADCPTKP